MNPELLEQVYTQGSRQIRAYIKKYILYNVDDEVLEEIFGDAFIRLIKLVELKKVSFDNVKSGINLLYKVAKFKALEYQRKRIDEIWYINLSEEDKELGLKPPSYWYHRKWEKDNIEKVRQYAIKYLHKHKDDIEFQKKRKEMVKAYRKTPKGKEANRIRKQRYRKTEKGKLANRLNAKRHYWKYKFLTPPKKGVKRKV